MLKSTPPTNATTWPVLTSSEAKAVLAATEGLFGAKPFLDLSEEAREILINELPNMPSSGDLLQDLVVLGVTSSKSQARTFIKNGAIQLNNQKIDDENIELKTGANLVKRGKNSFAIIVK